MSATMVVAKSRKDVDPKVWTPAHAAIIKAAAEDPKVERIFVNAAIKKALCRSTDTDRNWLRKVRPMWGHDYHFHIRMSCPADSPDCRAQDAVPPGDGCGKELDWWFRDAIIKPRPEPPSRRTRTAKPKPKPRGMTMADSAAGVPAGAAGAVTHRGDQREPHRDIERDRAGGDHHDIEQGPLARHLHQQRHAGPHQVESVEPEQSEKARTGDQQENSREPHRRERIDGQPQRAGIATLAAEFRRQEIDRQRHHKDRHEAQRIGDDGADQPGKERRVAADQRAADEACQRRDQGQDRDVSQRQGIAGFARDRRPFGLRRQHDRPDARDQSQHGAPRCYCRAPARFDQRLHGDRRIAMAGAPC